MRNIESIDAKKAAIMKRMFGGIVYTFHRAEGFYPITMQSDEEALACVPCNPGTLKIVNELTEDVIYELKPT